MAISSNFDPEKAVEAILYVAARVSHEPGFHRISKILYFADLMHLEDFGRQICGDVYVAMKHGPVPSRIYDMMKSSKGHECSELRGYVVGSFEIRNKIQVHPLRAVDLSALSSSEIRCLDKSIQENAHLSFGELTRKSHDYAWNSSDENDAIALESMIDMLPSSALLKDLLSSDPD